MNEQHESKFLDDSEFQSLLVACLESLERGDSIDRDALALAYPKYANEIGQFLEDQELLQQVASQFGDIEPSKVALTAYENTVDSKARSTPADQGDFAVGESIRYIGEYEILEKIAHGGMGIVFKAHQQKLNRLVALKMILAGKLADSSDVERFQREARAAGRLKHPNIVPVHEIGEYEGRHYFTMDYVNGPSLADEIREESLAPSRAAEIVKSTAEAVHFAHDQGTVHRDLKPANILLTDRQTPHITDFGLAKMLESVDEQSRAELTASGQILGTPSYMSPEQASGKQELVSTATDIYSLGAILYACLTGRAPFVADSQIDTLLQVMRKDPVSPRELNPSVPKDLETICLKCLNKEPHRRYGTAIELADDLDRYLKVLPVMARPVGPISRYYRWCRRNPVIAALSVLLFASMATGTVIATRFALDATRHAKQEEHQRRQAVEAFRTAEKQRILAEESRQEAERQQKAATLAKAQAEWSFSQEADARMQAQAARRDAVQSLYIARTHMTRLLWERGDEWGASLPHVDQFFRNNLTVTNPDPEIELETLNKMIAANPSDDFLHFLRGIYYAKRRQWQEALADFELSSNLISKKYRYHCEAASVALMVGDDEVFGRHVHSLLRYTTEFNQRGEILSGANVALIAALQPQSSEVLNELLPFTERWAKPNSSQFFRVKSLILVRMRMGEYKAVLKLLEPFSDESRFKRAEHIVFASSLRALAFYHLDRLNEAKQELKVAETVFNERLAKDFVVSNGSLQTTHHPFIQAHVLLTEARDLIAKDESEESVKTAIESAAPTMEAKKLVAKLESDDATHRAQALKKLAELGETGAAAVPKLLSLLKQPDSYEKTLVIRCLGRIGPAADRAVPALHDIFRSESTLA